MSEKEIQKALNEFDPAESSTKTALTKHITLWVDAETKAMYDKIQAACSNRFTKTLRKVVVHAVSDAASKLS